MTKRTLIHLILGLFLSGVAFYFAFKNVPLAELYTYVYSINYYWVTLSVVIGLISYVFRVIRWRIILESTHRISFWGAFHPFMIGFMMNCILPARIGEIARPMILMKNDHVPFPTGLASVVVERLFDMIFIIVLFILSHSAINLAPDFDIPVGGLHLNKDMLSTIFRGTVIISMALLSVMIMLAIDSIKKIIVRIIEKIPSLFFFAGAELKHKIAKYVSTPLLRIVENISKCFALIKDFRKIGLCILFTILAWVSVVYSYYVMSLGCPGINLGLKEITIVLVIICFFIALPSVPGFWGLWEAGGVFGLSLFGVSAKDAFGFTLANHAIQIIPCIAIGLLSALITGVNIMKVNTDR